MVSIKIHDVLRKRALVSRDSSRALKEVLSSVVQNTHDGLAVDFEGVDAISPSFVDELLFVIRSALIERGSRISELRFINPPTSPSAAYSAIARAHDISLEETAEGDWKISGKLSADPA
jgi:hypothetical protein